MIYSDTIVKIKDSVPITQQTHVCIDGCMGSTCHGPPLMTWASRRPLVTPLVPPDADTRRRLTVVTGGLPVAWNWYWAKHMQGCVG